MLGLGQSSVKGWRSPSLHNKGDRGRIVIIGGFAIFALFVIIFSIRHFHAGKNIGQLWDEVWHGSRESWHKCWSYVNWPDCRIHPGEVTYKLIFPPELGGTSQAYCQQGARTIKGTWILVPDRTIIEFLDIRGLPHRVTFAEWKQMKSRNVTCFRLILHPEDVPYMDRFSVHVVTEFTSPLGRL